MADGVYPGMRESLGDRRLGEKLFVNSFPLAKAKIVREQEVACSPRLLPSPADFHAYISAKG